LIHPIGELAATNDLRHLSHRRDSTHANSSSKTSIFNSLLGRIAIESVRDSNSRRTAPCEERANATAHLIQQFE
jgi:hypothetical protein